MAATFRTDVAGVEKMMVASWMVAEMLRRAEAVERVAEATAPVDEGGPHPGRYKESFVVTSGVRPKDKEPPEAKLKQARAYGRVSNTSPEARFVEYGTKYQEANHTLGRALDAARGA